MRFIVIANVGGYDYMVSVQAQSLAGAEHKILDRAACTPLGYGVKAAQAFDFEGMKTETFRSMALDAFTISEHELCEKIENENRLLLEAAAKKKRIEEIKQSIDKLEAELAELTEIRK